MSEKVKGFVKNDSQGYGYMYASLGDIVNQGYEIPKMKVEETETKQFVYYYDDELKEWIRGAEIVVPDSKGMNKAQLYGAALTYARRYTAHLALGLACGDDKTIEDINPDGTKKTGKESKKEPKKEEKPMTDEQADIIGSMEAKLQEWIANKFNLASWKELTYDQAQWYINAYKKKGEKDASGNN